MFAQVSPVVQVRIAQQGCPDSPQAAHICAAPFPVQARPLPQVSAVEPEPPPAPLLVGSQQGCPAMPHEAVHIETPPSAPLLQPRPGPQAVPPLQQGSPAWPHFRQAFCPVPAPFRTQPRPL